MLPEIKSARPRERDRRLTVYALPPLSDCRDSFQEWLGQPVDWEEP